jgi:hypothetical protein
VEFLSKWKDLARAKIRGYRDQCERLVADKAAAVKQRDQQID